MPSPSNQAELNELVATSGLRHVHLLAWRDLADDEAGGSEVHASTIAAAWAHAGLEVTMRTSFAPGKPETESRDGYRVVRRGGRFSVFPRGVLDELRGNHGRRDGLVEIWNGVPWLTPLWATGPRVLWMHHIHGAMWKMALPPGAAQLGDLLEHRLAPPFYRRTRIATLSQSSRDEMVHKLGWKREQIAVIPPGIDARFQPGETKSPYPLVVAVGRLMPAKHFDDLIRIVARLRESIPDLELIIVGEGSERPRLEAEIRSNGASSYVRLPGRLGDADLIVLYQRAWLLLATSQSEGWGMTITEAAACGTPAVVTDIGGHRDAVQPGITGELAPLHALGEVIGRVLLDTDYRRRLAAGARARAQELTWQATATATFRELALDAARRSQR